LKIWKVALVSLLALGLVLGVASPALAASPWASLPPADPPPRIIRGEVVSISGTSLVIESGWGETTVLVNDDTEYFRASVPPAVLSMSLQLEKPAEPSPGGLGLRQRLHLLVEGILTRVPVLVRNRLELRQQTGEELGLGRWLRSFGEEATFASIEVGSWVVVWVAPGEGDPVAERVVIIEPVAYHHISGTIDIIDTAAKTITIAPADGGDNVILSYDEETRFVLRGSPSLAVGDVVRAVYDEAGMAKMIIVVTDSD
jgi:hypothetical protein